MDFFRNRLTCVSCLLLLLGFAGCQQADKPTNETTGKPEGSMPAVAESPFAKTRSLFSGDSIEIWELTEFGGEGDVRVEDDCIWMDAGDPITAINLPESFELPTSNYELEFEAMKVEGTDFFATVTFPVKESFCSLVVGGWAGTVVGLSSIDRMDASENETRRLKKFESNQWYKIRVRVTATAIEAWIDDEQFVNQATEGKEISLRSEMIPCRPLGIANFYTISKIRNIELRWLKGGLESAPVTP